MPLTLRPKSAEKHLIFVKNIPTYLATNVIPELYIKYGAFNVKNVYPDAHITTAVISFRTKDEAIRAQEETDGMGLNNVILRVEMYNKQRSVRFLRGDGQAKHPLGTVEDYGEADSQEDEAYSTKAKFTSPLESITPALPNNAPTGTTWAHVAAVKSTLIMNSPPTKPKPVLPEVTAAGSNTPVATPRITVAVPHIAFMPSPVRRSPPQPNTSLDQSGHHNSAAVSSLATESLGAEHKNNSVGNRNVINTLDNMTQAVSVRRNVAAWEPIDTTERIRRRHCGGCYFCQLKTRRLDE